MELNEDEHVKQFKIMTLNSIGRSLKSSQNKVHKEATHDEASDEECNGDKMAFIIKIFQHMDKKMNNFSSRNGGFLWYSSRSDKDNHKG